LNAKGNKVGSISQVTYYVFIALQCVAPLVAMFLVSACFSPSLERSSRTSSS